MKSPANDPNRTVILSINDVEPGLIQAMKRHSAELGRELTGVVLVDADHATASGNKANGSDAFHEIIVDFDNAEQLQKVLLPYQQKLLAATCRSEQSIQYFRKVVPFLPYIYVPSERSLKWATEKNHMREKLATHALHLSPKFITAYGYTKKLLEEVKNTMAFPVIVKPSGLAASILVSKCDNVDQLRKTLKRTFKILRKTYERDGGRGEVSLLIEEMIPGDMYSVDAYVDHMGNVYCLPLVKVITAHSLGYEGFYSYQHDMRITLPKSIQKDAIDTVQQAIHALQLSSSTAHVELFYTGEEWKIIELGPRIGGYREDLYREEYGIDHYYNDLAIRMGREPEIKDKVIKHAYGMNMYAEEEGVIESITGLEEAQQLESVVYLEQHMFAGDTALFARNGGRLIIDGILSNEDQAALDRDMKKVREIIAIKINN